MKRKNAFINLSNRTGHAAFAAAKKQSGVTAVEFSIVGLLFFMVLLGTIEVGRLMFTVNMLANVSKVTARLAAVCPPSEGDIIKTTAKAVSSFNLIDNSNITIAYLADDMEMLDATDAGQFENIYFVRTQIVNYQHEMFIPGFNVTLNLPGFDTLLPSESLGVLPLDKTGAGLSCAAA